MSDKTFVINDWQSYHRLIPEDQWFTHKDLTYRVGPQQRQALSPLLPAQDQDSSQVSHHGRSVTALAAAPENPITYAKKLLAILG